jgi:hypothetical protein
MWVNSAEQKKIVTEQLLAAYKKPVPTVAEVPGFELSVDEERFPAVVQETSYKAFAPANVGVHLPRFQALAEKLASERPGVVRALIEEEIEWAAGIEAGFAPELRPRSLRRYRAALSVLVDLLGQNWAYRFRDHHLEMAPPDFTEASNSPEGIAKQKRQIRLAMKTERLAQLQPESVRRFISEMEASRSHYGKSECSILDLVADGKALVADLTAAKADLDAGNAEPFLGVVQPYLQLAREDDRCPETGLRLIDIWRYFRYFWSLPYFSTPGRNLFYLVRDQARPFHPVIGIAALGNSIVRLADRERFLGWDVEGIQASVDAATDPVERQALLEHLYRHYLQQLEVDIAALDPKGIVTAAELAAPTMDLVQRLLSDARESAYRRKELLRSHEARAPGKDGDRARPVDPSKLNGLPENVRTLADKSVEELFKQKRAAQYAELLRAKLVFRSAAKAGEADGMSMLLRDEEGRRALGIAVRTVKQAHIGSSIMDIIIAGAVPPYNELLGGKLVCMLLTSPQVRVEYFQRYSNSPSEIASKMRGTAHARAADLVFLGTTSLYHVGSSQYNRVRVPASIRGESAPGEVKYQRLGETRGYGSVHFSDRTRDLLEEMLKDEQGATFITRTFGEGVNPKLRLVREGLNVIGLDQDHFLRHQCRRIIYGVPLAHNTGAYLRNEVDTPRYILPSESEEEALRWSDSIADHWKIRWLSSRIKNPDVMARVAASSSREEIRISQSIGPGETPFTGPQRGPVGKGGGGGTPPPPAGEIGVRFIQQLYNHRNCYADRLSETQLDAIHVETTLEPFILELLKAGKDVILTGNPGDGKTHLIMRMMPRIIELKAECHADATAEESYETLLDLWKAARKRQKPFCLAINEWPLLEFVKAHGDDFKPLQEIRSQVEKGVVYQDEPGKALSVVVIDLNNRNLVTKPVYERLVATLTSERFYPECPQCPARHTCDVPRARTALQQPRVADRLFTLLELTTKRGHHVTMRDLQGFLAFVLTGGRSCEQLVSPESEHRAYSDLAFEGESDLFDAVRAVFDPAHVTHPLYDDALWMGELDPSGWTTLGPPSPPPSRVPDLSLTIEAMRTAKRRFYFENESGEDLLNLLPADEMYFFKALQNAATDNEGVVRELTRLINRFFDPRDTKDSAVRLWSRHCYDARWSPTYISVRSIGIDTFRIQIPRLPAHTKPAFHFQADHLIFAAYQNEKMVAQLMVDLPLYQTLYDARRGLPMALRSAEVTKRLDKFFNELGRSFQKAQNIEDVHIKNFKSGASLEFRVDRRQKRYAL